MFLFVKTKYLYYNLLDLSIKIFLLLLYLNRLLVGYRKYLIPLAIIISLVLSGVFNIPSILGIRNNYATIGLAIKINRFLITNI
jgi:hypothetical protein